MGGGGLMTALAGPSTASADFGGLGTALATDVSPAAAVGGAGGLGGVGAAPVLAAAGGGSSIGPMSVPPSWAGGARNPGGEHARHVGVAELGRRRTRRGDVDRDSGHHGRHARGRQRRSRRLQLRSPALRRQAQGHAVDPQADAHLGTQTANAGRFKPQTQSDQLRDGIKNGF